MCIESPPSGEGTSVASTVTWDGLRDLAGFRAQNGCAISLYLDLDPSVTPTAADLTTRVNALIDEIERSEAARRPELDHEQKEGLRSDVQRLRSFFEQDFDRDGARGLAVFCASLDNLWQPLPLSSRVPRVVKVGNALSLAPLVSLVGRGEGALVVFVGRERGDLFRLRAGKLEELVDQFDDAPGRHDQGGWSQARFQRHIDKLVHDHLKEVAELVDRQLRRLRGPRVIVVASEETRGELETVLSHEAKKAVIGWTTADAHATAAELLGEVQPLIERWRGEQENQAGGGWAGGGGKPSKPRGTAASNCCSSRTASSGRPGSAPPAGASTPTVAPARSTARRWSSAATGSTSPSARPWPTAERSGRSRSTATLTPS